MRVYGWFWTELPSCVLCPISEEVEEHEEQEEDSGNEMNLVPERRVYDSKTGIEISREKVVEGREAEMEEMMKPSRGRREEAHPCKVA